jgi:hypothetical protein
MEVIGIGVGGNLHDLGRVWDKSGRLEGIEDWK